MTIRLRTTLMAGILATSLGACDCDEGAARYVDGGNLNDAGLAGDAGAPVADRTPGVFVRSLGGAEAPGEARQQDILWVIDNSGTMCEEQQAARREFDRFIEPLITQNIDFQIGVTTTHMPGPDSSHSLEPVARAGHLQSTPQPVPSPFGSCVRDGGDPGVPDDGFEKVRDALDAAIGCTADPAQWQQLADMSDTDIACHADASCGTLEELFPPTDAYRDLPKILRASDYRSASGAIDRVALAEDFACISLVGQRGYPLEKGLGAAVEAVSPQMTGGSVESPTDASAPNHGLIRRNAEFGLVFITDENDCTHDGTLPELTVCASNICAIANNPNLVDSPLVDPSLLAARLVGSLEATKDRPMTDDEITVASIHGRWNRYGATQDYPSGPAPTLEDCEDGQEPPDESLLGRRSCDTSFGTAYSGDRYERFLDQFVKTYPPRPEFDDQHRPGLICRPDAVSNSLTSVGTTISARLGACLEADLLACADQGAGCPTHRFSDAASACTTVNGSAVCDSAIEVQLVVPDDPNVVQTLLDTEYCVPGSVGADDLPTGCVVDPSKYTLAPCNGGVTFDWVEADATDVIDGLEVRVRYLTNDYVGE